MKEKKIQIPLRYPGSKVRLIDYFEALIKKNKLVGSQIVEPYAGSAVISLNMLARGLVSRATLVEKDPLLYSFWKSIKTNPQGLIQRIIQVEVNLSNWKEHQKYLVPDALKKYELVELGAACIFLNRTSFSGIVHAGPIGGYSQKSQYKVNCRFQNKDRIVEQIEKLAGFSKRLSIVHGSAIP